MSDPVQGANDIRVTIDGQETLVERGTTILQAATDLNIEIPTLCHHPALEPYGACRLCTVEALVRGRWRLVTSCNYPIREEIEVRTKTETLQRVYEGDRTAVRLQAVIDALMLIKTRAESL